MAEVGEDTSFFDAETSGRKDSSVFGFGHERHHDGDPGGVG
jgi:hypothetical protein